MDPWERTGAAPQGWASHLHQSVPVQGYIQLRPQDTTLPSFGGCSTVPAGTDLMRSALRVDNLYELWIELAMTGESLTGCCYLGGYRTMCGRRSTERR